MVEKKSCFQLVANIVMAVLALCCLFPFLLLVMSSLTDENTLIREGYSIIPKHFGLDSYAYLWKNADQIGLAYGITILVTFVGTISSMLLTVLMAYPLSRREFFGRNVCAFYVIMMRTYFNTNIPEAVIEAARIDGAGEWRILFTIVLPMSLPMIATMALLIGLGYWNDWKNGLYYLTDSRLYSIQNMLNQMLKDIQFLKSGADASAAADLAQDMPSVGIKMAIAVVGALPVMIVYPFFQKYFVKGITIGAVKG